MEINIIVAMDMNNGIGIDGRIPWKAPADMAYFKSLTLGTTVIMGRKTHDSIIKANGGNLDGRRSIVITRNPDAINSGALVVEDPFFALTHISKGGTAWVIGGGEIYRELMPLCDNLFVTVVKEEFECDTFFPMIRSEVWGKPRVQKRLRDDKNPEMCFRVYRNKIANRNKRNR